MEYFIMAYGRDFEPMAEIFCESYMILEFYAMSTCWPNVQWKILKDCEKFVKALIEMFDKKKQVMTRHSHAEDKV